MLDKQTLLDHIEISREGIISVKLALQILEDGSEIANQWHRTSLEPGQNVDTMIALVNSALVQMGQKPISQGDINKIKQAVGVIHTPQVIADFKTAKAAKSAEG